MIMEEKEIELDGEKIKIVTKLPSNVIDDNDTRKDLDDTIDLESVIEEIKSKK